MAAPVGAVTLSGEVTGGDALGGGFVKLTPEAALVVGQDTYQDPNLYAFDEDQNIELTEDTFVDIGGLIPAGTGVASHYVFFDPAGGTRQVGWVEFDSAVLGLATQQGTLARTDFLANTSVTYLNPSLRGLEWQDRVWIDPDNPFRIWVDWVASSPGDYIRVFTALSPGV